eukprot:243248_1
MGKKGGSGNKGGGKKQQKDDQDFDQMLKELQTKTKEAGQAKEEIAKKKAKHQPKPVVKENRVAVPTPKGDDFAQAMDRRLQQQKIQQLLAQMQAMGGMGGFGSPFLSAPKTEIATETKKNALFDVATVDMQGWRKDMEDSHFNELDFSPSEKCGFFGVFDGHSGQKVALEAKVEMPRLTKKHYDATQLDTANFFHNVYSELDLFLKSRAEGSGATAVVALISEDYITCASVGDSRAVLCRGDKAVDLCEDHKPENEQERIRIEAAGRHVANNRVNGELAMSRAIGDFRYKEVEGKAANEQLVTAVPDMVTVARQPEDKFVVVACDGIFDVMSNEEVIAFVVEQRPLCKDLAEVGAKMLEHCLAPESEAGSGRPLRGEGTDNMTCTIIELL